VNNYSWIVLTNCVAGTDERYEAWYDNIHIPDLLRIPGIVSAKRGRVSNVQTIMVNGALELSRSAGQNYRFMAIYTIETKDPEGVLADVIRRANTPELMITPDLLEAHTILYQNL
jgi:hypothetical protein